MALFVMTNTALSLFCRIHSEHQCTRLPRDVMRWELVLSLKQIWRPQSISPTGYYKEYVFCSTQIRYHILNASVHKYPTQIPPAKMSRYLVVACILQIRLNNYPKYQCMLHLRAVTPFKLVFAYSLQISVCTYSYFSESNVMGVDLVFLS